MWLLLCLCVLPALAQDAPSVNITQGVIIGSRVVDGDYLSFYGIHYGGNTAGANRFKAPTDPPQYPGEYHAINSDVICAQPSTRGLIGMEDCLVLNVHTKNLTTPKPVFVWLEGEEYESSSRILYPFKSIVQEGLVVVSLNYRLSIFGFLCLGVPEAPGNAGLKDVIKGLQWIKDNIAAFGGDPNNVMLVGHGSGAAMVDLITLSPMSRNLIHKAAVLSGSGLAPWAVSYDPIGYAQKVGDKLGYTGKTESELARHFVTTDINVLSSVLTDFEFYNNTPLFAPCVENVKLNGTFLPDAPINIIRSGNYTDIPYLAGFTDREGTLRAHQAALRNWLSIMDANFEDFLPVDLTFESEVIKANVSRNVRQFYFAQRAINMETIEDFLDYEGDVLILVPVTRGVKERALTSSSPVRLFQYAYRGTRNSDWVFPQIPVNGVRHGGILNYLYNFDLKIDDNIASKSLIRRFVAFAQTGSPNPTVNPMMDWMPITRALTNTLSISGEEVSPNVTIYKEVAMGNLNAERINFWDDIYSARYRPPRPVSSAESLLSIGLVVLLSQIVVKLM